MTDGQELDKSRQLMLGSKVGKLAVALDRIHLVSTSNAWPDIDSTLQDYSASTMNSTFMALQLWNIQVVFFRSFMLFSAVRWAP